MLKMYFGRQVPGSRRSVLNRVGRCAWSGSKPPVGRTLSEKHLPGRFNRDFGHAEHLVR
jgi:hypothetical protein